MVLVTVFGVASAASPAGCPQPTSDDAGGWAALGGCLQAEGLPEAATEAWQRAFEQDPKVDGVLDAATALAHETGDDALLVEVVRTLPGGGPTDDLRGHVALADGRLDEVPPGTCGYPIARYRAAIELVRQRKPKSGVLAFGEVGAVEAVTGPEWRTDAVEQLQDAALVGVASVTLGLEDDGGLQFSRILLAGAFPDLRGYAQVFGTWRYEGAAVRLRVERDAFAPEAAALVGDAEIERWRGVSASLVAFLGAHPDPADPAMRRFELDPTVADDIGRVLSVALLEGIAGDVEAERRSVARDPAIAGLLEVRAAEVGRRLGAATLSAVRARLARIDAAVAAAERDRSGIAGSAPVVWSTTDYGD